MTDAAVVQELSLEGADNARLANFVGPMDQNLRHVEDRLGVDVRRRGHRLQVFGPGEAAVTASTVLKRIFELSATETMTPDRVHLCVQELGFPQVAPASARSGDGDVAVHTQRGAIRGRGANQRQYLEQIRGTDLTFGIGPAGTGKTYLAVAAAVEALTKKRVRRIVLARPAVEAGENLGFLPGDMQAKIDP